MKKKIVTLCSIVAGLLFINAGLNKFLNYMPVPEDLPEGLINTSVHMMEIGWLMPLIGVAEIIGGALLFPNRTRALGVIVILPVMVGIVLVHATVAPSGLPFAIGLAAVLVWIGIENRNKYYHMVQ